MYDIEEGSFIRTKEVSSTDIGRVYMHLIVDLFNEGYREDTEERTICDLILNNCEYRLIDQSLDTYIYNPSDLSKLYAVAEHYGITELLNSSIADLQSEDSDYYYS